MSHGASSFSRRLGQHLYAIYQDIQALESLCRLEASAHESALEEMIHPLAAAFVQVRADLAVARPDFSEAFHTLARQQNTARTVEGEAVALVQQFAPDCTFERVEEHYALCWTPREREEVTWKVPLYHLLEGTKAALWDAGFYTPADAEEREHLHRVINELYRDSLVLNDATATPSHDKPSSLEQQRPK